MVGKDLFVRRNASSPLEGFSTVKIRGSWRKGQRNSRGMSFGTLSFRVYRWIRLTLPLVPSNTFEKFSSSIHWALSLLRAFLYVSFHRTFRLYTYICFIYFFLFLTGAMLFSQTACPRRQRDLKSRESFWEDC